MLPALTLHSAMNVAMTATLTATRPFRFDSRVLMPVLGLLDRFAHVSGKFAHAAMLPRKAAAASVRVIILRYQHSIHVAMLATPARPIRRRPRMAEPMH
jgi:hypothetical protein